MITELFDYSDDIGNVRLASSFADLQLKNVQKFLWQIIVELTWSERLAVKHQIFKGDRITRMTPQR